MDINAIRFSFLAFMIAANILFFNQFPRISIRMLQVKCNCSVDQSLTPTPSALPKLYVITATYRRPEQIPEILRLGYTLKHVPNLFWLVVEEAESPTPLLTEYLKRIGVPFVHLTVHTPLPYSILPYNMRPHGVSNHNRGLDWIRQNATEGVLYFADDDNSYDLRIFEQMRYTKKVSIWPTGLTTYSVSTPIIRNGVIKGFYTRWTERKYGLHMSGFAVNVKFLLSRPNATMPYVKGFQETLFLQSLEPLDYSELEVLASNATEILVWHTKTVRNKRAIKLNMSKYNGTNLVELYKILV